MNNEQETPKDSATPGLHIDAVAIHASCPEKKTALITPPKDIKDQTLSPSATSVRQEPPGAPRLDAPFSPIRTDTLECGHDYEPLPYRVNIFEGLSSQQFTPISWRQVYSPLQSSPKEIKNPPFIDLSSNEEITPKKSSVDNETSNEEITPKANSHADDETNDSLISSSDVTSSSPRPPYNQQWPILPPPSNYWYHQQYQYVYPPHHPHHPHHLHPHHPPPSHSGGSHADQKHRLAHPTLYPKPPRNGGGGGHDPYAHAFLSPSMPYGHFRSAVPIPYHPVEYIAEKDVTVNDVICGRGGAVNNHPGNMRFRQLISKFKHQYMTESKQSKPYVAVRVLEAVKSSSPPGRFLVKYPGGYLECGDDRAREKAKQALREGAAKMRKQQGYGGGGTESVGSDDTASLFDINNEKRGMSRILLPNERYRGGGGGASIEMEYQLDPKYSVVFEPPRNKKKQVDDDDNPPRMQDGDDDDLEPASKKMKQEEAV